MWLAARRVDEALAGHELTRGEFRVPQLAVLDLVGATVTEVRSRGKHMLTRFTDGHTLHSHFRMDGTWHIYPTGRAWRGGPEHSIRAILSTADRDCVGYRLHDLSYLPTDEEHRIVGHLGPDLLGPDWDAEEALNRLRANPTAEIGVALLDQRNLAGIGTLYRTEGLYLSGIAPQRTVGEVEDLPGVVSRIRRLLLANRERPEQSTTGRTGRGQSHWIFERARQPCRRCGATIRTGEQGPPPYQRVSYWCPTCQR